MENIEVRKIIVEAVRGVGLYVAKKDALALAVREWRCVDLAFDYNGDIENYYFDPEALLNACQIKKEEKKEGLS